MAVVVGGFPRRMPTGPRRERGAFSSTATRCLRSLTSARRASIWGTRSSKGCDNDCVTVPEILVLWDVDHTLIENGGVSKETYALAFQLLVGKLPLVRPETDGRTDILIMQELFIQNSLSLTAEYKRKMFPALVEAMRRNSSALRSRGYALPGALEALAALDADPCVMQSVLTGNIPENAYVKLSTFGLDKYIDFEIGGYGSDHLARAKLVAFAQRRASSKFGVSFDQRSTILIGDTTRDVRAGLDGGAGVLAVATGVSSIDELRGAGANRVIPSLVDTQVFLKALEEVRDVLTS